MSLTHAFFSLASQRERALWSQIGGANRGDSALPVQDLDVVSLSANLGRCGGRSRGRERRRRPRQRQPIEIDKHLRRRRRRRCRPRPRQGPKSRPRPPPPPAQALPPHRAPCLPHHLRHLHRQSELSAGSSRPPPRPRSFSAAVWPRLGRDVCFLWALYVAFRADVHRFLSETLVLRHSDGLGSRHGADGRRRRCRHESLDVVRGACDSEALAGRRRGGHDARVLLSAVEVPAQEGVSLRVFLGKRRRDCGGGRQREKKEGVFPVFLSLSRPHHPSFSNKTFNLSPPPPTHTQSRSSSSPCSPRSSALPSGPPSSGRQRGF